MPDGGGHKVHGRTGTRNGVGAPKTYTNLDDVVAAIEDARVWGGLHYRTTMTETAKHFPRIARDVGRKYFLDRPKGDGPIFGGDD